MKWRKEPERRRKAEEPADVELHALFDDPELPWNVTGPMITTLYTLIETRFNDLALAVDEVAEDIRSLGSCAPGSFSAYTDSSAVQEAQN